MSRLAVLIIKQTEGIKQKAVKIGENRIRLNKKAVSVMDRSSDTRTEKKDLVMVADFYDDFATNDSSYDYSLFSQGIEG